MSIYIFKCDIGGNSISESLVSRAKEDCSEAPQSLSFETNDRLGSLENKLDALETRLKESQDMHSARIAHIADLLGSLGETNKSIKDLENSNNRMKTALAIFGVLFTSSTILVGFRSYFTILISEGITPGISQDITQNITQGVVQGMHILSQYVRQ